MNKPRSALVFTNLPSISPQSDFFGWCIFVLFCIANMLNYGISLVWGGRGGGGGAFSLKTHLEVSSNAQARQVWEQSSLQVNSFVLEVPESSAIDPGLRLGTKNGEKHSNESWNWSFSCPK